MVSVASLLVMLPQALVTMQRTLPPRPEMELMFIVGVVAPETSNAGVPWVLRLMPLLSAAHAVAGPNSPWLKSLWLSFDPSGGSGMRFSRRDQTSTTGC